MVRFFMAACLAGAALVTPTVASAQDTRLERVIDGITASDLRTAIMLADSGAEFIDNQLTQSDPNLFLVRFSNGKSALLLVTACDGGKCTGIEMLAFFDPPSGVSQAVADERVRVYNNSQRVMNGFRDDDGDYAIQGYIIGDNGISLGAVATYIGVFASIVDGFSDALYDQ